MNEFQDEVYWMALAHLPDWPSERINSLLIEILDTRNLALAEFFQLSEGEWRREFQLIEKETADLFHAKLLFPQFFSLAENLRRKEIELLPSTFHGYPESLKQHLALQYPPLLYTKGDLRLLQEPAAAIVASDNASEVSFRFAEQIAQKCVEQYQVVVTGSAKGFGQAVLESILRFTGKCILVLPQGILKFTSGFTRYAAQILAGDMLVLSTFPPKASWNKSFARAHNRTIYGLANDIYIAKSDSTGHTWIGAIDGLNQGRKIYVREPGEEEHNANKLLIHKGAIPVNADGNPLSNRLITRQKRERKGNVKSGEQLQGDLFG